MFEIEKMEQQFDYSLVDSDTADFLRSCEYEINGIAEDARVKFGKVLVKAREKLANHHGGVFQKWYESGGLDRNNVYYYMDLYESSRNLENSKRENFLKAPKTVQKKVMQKNTPDEVREAVYSGEVQTNKELEELNRQLKKREQENDILQKQLEQAENKPPEIIERYTEPERIEVIPDDYDYIKGNYESAISLRDRYKKQLEEMRVELESSRSVVSSDGSQYESLKARGEQLKNKISSYEKLYDLQSQLELVLSKIHLKTHSLKLENVKDEVEIINELDSTLDEVIKVCENLKIKISKKESL